MIDQYGREINYLRISVTDRCNLRCSYCMPDEEKHMDMQEILTYEEIYQVAKEAANLGFSHIRLTGGEPLVRKDVDKLISMLRDIEGIENISMTSNGVLLSQYAVQLKEAGLDEINISLDAIDPLRYQEITGRDEVHQVLEGINAALGCGLSVKINAVNMHQTQTMELVEFCQKKDLVLRFIEMMPIGEGTTHMEQRNEELMEELQRPYGNPKEEEGKESGHGPARYYSYPKLKTKIGFISAMGHKFCDQCNRVRLTADGRLKLCLCFEESLDVKKILREQNESLSEKIRDMIYNKKPKEQITI